MGRSSGQDWGRLVSEQSGSGETIKSFCARRGLNQYTFKKNKYALQQAAAVAPGFIELREQQPVIRVKLRNGRELELSGGFNEVELQRLVRVLETC
jgi:hypothetical protein